MAKTSKQALLNEQYTAIRNEIMRNVQNLERRGYRVEGIPKIPKRIRPGSIRRIEKWTDADYLHKHTYYEEPIFGRSVSYKVEEARRKSEASKKGWVTRRAKKNAVLLDRLAGATNVLLDDLEDNMPGYADHLRKKLEMILEKAQISEDGTIGNPEYVNWVAPFLDEHWSDIQKAFEVMERYEDPYEVPYWADRVLLVLSEAAGTTYTQEDAMVSGTLESFYDPDYYPS